MAADNVRDMLGSDGVLKDTERYRKHDSCFYTHLCVILGSFVLESGSVKRYMYCDCHIVNKQGGRKEWYLIACCVIHPP